MSNSKDEPSLPHQLLLKTETHYEFIVRPNAEKAPGLTIESVLKIKRNSNDLSVDTDDSLNLPIYQHMVNDNKWNLSRGPKSKAAETDDSWGKIPPVRPVECDSLEHSFAERAMDACYNEITSRILTVSKDAYDLGIWAQGTDLYATNEATLGPGPDQPPGII